MDWIIGKVGGWLLGLVVLGLVLLVGNVILWLWHKATKGTEEIVAFYLVTEAASVAGWVGHGLTKTSQGGMSVSLPEVLQFLFGDRDKDLATEVQRLFKAAKTSSLLAAPAGSRVSSKEEAVSYAGSVARRSISSPILEKAKVYSIESTNRQAGKAFVVLLGNVPGKASRLRSGS